MLISYNWLQTYFKEKLPTASKIEEALTFHVFEIDGVEEKVLGGGDDTVFDVKVLPDRMHYALSHRGVAYELSAILSIPQILPERATIATGATLPLEIHIDSPDSCSRYVGRRIEHIIVGDSPLWLKERLEAIGQRSINSIVDAANYVMLDTNQPLHAFDADKVVGSIHVRLAKEGEKIVTLDGKEVQLDPTILVIADDEAPLAIAGIKGGKKAEVTENTRNLIIEAANFDVPLIRKTSNKVGIKNDSSKRYENGITSELAVTGMREVTALIKEFNPEAVVGNEVDMFVNKKEQTVIIITPDEISTVLGIQLATSEIKMILTKLNIVVEEKGDELVLTIPYERLDLVIGENIIEEVGRLYGYDKITPRALPETTFKPSINKKFYWSMKIRNILAEQSFSEVFSYSLAAEGDFEIEKSIASDKNFIRPNLTTGIVKSLEMNTYNAPLLGLDKVRVFEIGNVFPKQGEYTALCIAIAHTRNAKGESINEEIRQTREHLLKELGANVITVCTIDDTGGLLMIKNKQIGMINNVDGILELNLDALIEILPDPETILPVGGVGDEIIKSSQVYQPISTYPFMLRDIAVFVPGEQGRETEVLETIKGQATTLLVRADLFDIFTKTFKETGEVKTSYAYRLVFQSHDRTLSDDEINPIMNEIGAKMVEKGWVVR